MNLKYLTLTDDLYNYACGHGSHANDPVLEALREETVKLGEEPSRMQISPEQGSFMTVLAAAVGATSAIEVGTFTGYSSICIARGLTNEGRLICLDNCVEWTDIARRYWAQAGVQDKIELRIGAAISELEELRSDLNFDFAFIDADKTEYDRYYELILPKVRQNGLILFDNMLWGGKLGAGEITEDTGRAIDALNRKLAEDTRVETVLLTLADGIQLCRKR